MEEEDPADTVYLPFKSGILVSSGALCFGGPSLLVIAFTAHSASQSLTRACTPKYVLLVFPCLLTLLVPVLTAADPNAAPTRASQRLQRRASRCGQPLAVDELGASAAAAAAADDDDDGDFPSPARRQHRPAPRPPLASQQQQQPAAGNGSGSATLHSVAALHGLLPSGMVPVSGGSAMSPLGSTASPLPLPPQQQQEQQQQPAQVAPAQAPALAPSRAAASAAQSPLGARPLARAAAISFDASAI